MIQTNQTAFEALTTQLSQLGPYSVQTGKRYIKTGPEERRWLKECSIIEMHPILPAVRSAKLSFNKRNYLLVSGQIIEGLDPQLLSEVEINSGLSTLLIAERLVRLNLNIDPLKFWNDILFQHLDPGYRGHEIQDLLPFLETAHLYELPENSVLNRQKLSRSLVYIFSNNPSSLILKFEKDVLDACSEIALMGSDKISYTLILNCLLSTNYNHAFLEIYRLVERLFAISYLKEFHSNLMTKVPLLEFSASLEDSMGWKPREEDALKKLFKNLSPTVHGHFQNFMASIPNLTGHRDSSFFYKLRNSIVHFRPTHQDPNLTELQWNQLILATLYILDEHYSKLGSFL